MSRKQRHAASTVLRKFSVNQFGPGRTPPKPKLAKGERKKQAKQT